MGEPISIDEQISRSLRASAVERAFQVAKALEGSREAVAGLQWVDPEKTDKRMSRKIDFSEEFPDETSLQPIPIDVTVNAPSSALVPDEKIYVNWTMPLLSRVTKYEEEDRQRAKTALGAYSLPVRHGIDIVSFLPFPKANATEAEKFKPEFFLEVRVDHELGFVGNMYGAVIKYGDKVVKQFVNSQDPHAVNIFADPYTTQLFNAQMLVNMSDDALAATAENAGELEIYVYRVTKRDDIAALLNNISHAYQGENTGHTTSSTLFPTRSSDPSPSRGSGFTPRVLPTPTTPSPTDAPKEVGDVSIGEGTSGPRATYRHLSGYHVDTSFGIQPIRVRFLGVRETSQGVNRQLETLAQAYK